MRLLARALAAKTASTGAAVRLLAFFLVTAFTVEVVVMLLLPRIVPLNASPIVISAVDATLLATILGPITWWVFLIPLTRMHDARGLLLERLLSAQEDERARISRDLHDGLGQSLTSLLLRLRVLEESSLNDEARDNVATIRQITASSLDDLRKLVRETRPPILADLGLAAALEKQLDDAQQASGLAMSLEWHSSDEARLPADVETVLYRVIQEAVTNTMKHAAASRAMVSVTVGPDNVTAFIADDGVGFDMAEVRSGSRKPFGLLGMIERVLPFGGTVHIANTGGKGTTVTARIPLTNHKLKP